MTTRRTLSARTARRISVTLLVAAIALLVATSLDTGHASGAQLAPRVDEQRWVDLRTVPAVPGAVFELDGRSYRTDGAGVVSIPAFGLTGLAGRLHFVSAPSDATTHIDFVRFSLPPQQGYRRPAVAVFAVQRAVSFRFADPTGASVPPGRLTSMTIRSSTGELRKLSGPELVSPVMLPATDVTSSDGDLQPRDLRYTVQDVIVDGTSTVNRSQQDFYPARTTDLQVDTLFFTVRVSARDGVFGGATGDAVRLRRPDGSESRFPLIDGEATLAGLPRGDYQLLVESSGVQRWQPVAVTRDQTVQVDVVTTRDIVAAAVAGLVLVVGLVVLGRRRRRSRRRGPRGRDPRGHERTDPPRTGDDLVALTTTPLTPEAVP